jgi:hypothetical protein
MNRFCEGWEVAYSNKVRTRLSGNSVLLLRECDHGEMERTRWLPIPRVLNLVVQHSTLLTGEIWIEIVFVT